MDGFIINNLENQYSENLFSEKSVFDGTIPLNKTGGTSLATIGYSDEFVFKKGLSIKSHITDADVINVPFNQFNLGNALSFTSARQGIYVFSFRALHDFSSMQDSVVEIIVTKFVNSIPEDISFIFEKDNSNLKWRKWYNFAQTFTLQEGDFLDFSFKHLKENGSSIPQSTLYLDGFKLELEDRFISLSTPYSLPIPTQKTGWQSIVNTSTSQTIPATTETQIIFTGVEEQNGGLDFLDNTGVITPLKLGDTLTIDVAFSFVVPAGTNNHFDFYIKVGTFIYRSVSIPILKTTGDTQYFSQSFTLPVSTDFATTTAKCYINSTVGLTISNRYISVARLHKGIV